MTIISILEAMQPLPLDKVLVIREKMLREPKAWVGDIAAILVGLQDIDQDGRPTAAILKKINNAINGTLRCLGFEGDNTLLITQVRDVLFAQNYISWGEKKHCCRATLFAAPKESIDVSTIEDLDVSTIEDLDVSTIEDWEQQELDRQDYEMYNAC